MQFFEPSNWSSSSTRRSSTRAGAISSAAASNASFPHAPPEALAAKRREVTEATHVHAEDAGTQPTIGYRPGGKGAKRR